MVGSGIGGLAAAALLAKVGKRVLVLEQHGKLGGCCHTFTEHGFEFDTGTTPPPPGTPGPRLEGRGVGHGHTRGFGGTSGFATAEVVLGVPGWDVRGVARIRLSSEETPCSQLRAWENPGNPPQILQIFPDPAQILQISPSSISDL